MEKELPDPKRIFIENISLLIRADMHTIDVDLAIVHTDKRLLDTALAHPERFYLSPMECNSRLIGIQNKIIMVCLLIIGDHLPVCLCHMHDLLLSKHSLLPPYPDKHHSETESAISKSIVRSILSASITRTRTRCPNLYTLPECAPAISYRSS